MTEEEFKLIKLHECLLPKLSEIDRKYFSADGKGEIWPHDQYSINYFDLSITYNGYKLSDKVKNEIEKAVEECKLFVYKPPSNGIV